MPNTFTTNFNLTKPEVGGANDTWGTLINSNLTDLDTQLYRKADKLDQKGVTHTLSFDSNTKLVTTSVTRGFASFAVGDKIDITHSGNAANKGEFKIEGITNDITIDLELLDDTEPSFVTESISSVVSIMPEITKTIGSLDVSGDTLTTSTAQKDAIVDGSSAISRNAGGIKSISITAAGSSYSGNGTLSATGGAGSSFAGAYTVSSGAVFSIDITNAGSGYTSVPTIVLTPASGSAGSGATITAVLQTTNDVIFASDVTVTGDLYAGVIGAATLTSGSIAEEVTMEGVPRKTILIRVNESAHQWNNSTTERVVHDSISFSATSGKSYIIELHVGTLWIWTQNTLESPFHDSKMYRHTSAKTRADTSSLGTKINAGSSYNSHLRAAQGASHIGIQYPGMVFLATFTASTTQTEYIHLTGTNGNAEVYCQYQFDVGGGLYYKIQEFDSYSYTTVT